MNNFKVAIVDCSYRFWPLGSNRHQAVQQKCEKEIIWQLVGEIPALQVLLRL